MKIGLPQLITQSGNTTFKKKLKKKWLPEKYQSKNFKNWVLLNCAPTSTQLYPPPPSSTQLHPPPPSSFQPPHSSLEHPQQYLNQNIARNWTISSNLRWKIKSSSFWLKIGRHAILEVLIPNPELDFWNSDPKIHFGANLCPKIQSCPFCLKIGAHSISRMLIPNSDLDFSYFDPKMYFWANLCPKGQSCPFCLKIGAHSISRMLISSPDFDFWNSDPKMHFWANLCPKSQSCPFVWKLVHMVSQRCWFLYEH